MSDLVNYVILGIPYGCVFALVAVGVVLTYKTAGVFNLAFGAQAFLSAAVFYNLRVRGVSWLPASFGDPIPAFVLAVLVVAPLFGLLLQYGIFRYLRSAPPAARLVSALGLLVAIPEIVKIVIIGDNQTFGVVGIWPDDNANYHLGPYNVAGWQFGVVLAVVGAALLFAAARGRPRHVSSLTRRVMQAVGIATVVGAVIVVVSESHTPLGQYVLDGRQMAIIFSTAAAVVALTALFRWSTIGLEMRAVVESPRMTELAGINADRVSSFAWALSSVFAGLAGVLLAPLLAQLDSIAFTTLLVSAIAAAAFGRLVSIPLTLLGGILLGVTQGLLAGYLPPASVIARNLRPSLPFFVLFLLLVLMPALRGGRELTDPLAGVDPPPPGLAAQARPRWLSVSTWIFGTAMLGGTALYLLLFSSNYWLGIFTKGLVLSIVFLSITVITGMAGQVSLSQAAFAGIGAFGTAQLVTALDLPVIVAIVLSAFIAAAVGALLAIPALRLGGIYLSLATLAFALMFENIFVPMGWVGGGVSDVRVPRPVIGPIDFASDKSFFVLCIAILAIMGTLVIFVRRGTTGRYLQALRGSEVASEAIGINQKRAKITAFAFSAAIAGIGGGLLATQTGIALRSDYVFFWGLLWVVTVVTLGARTVEGAINAGVGLALFPEFLKSWLPWILNHVQPIWTIGPLPPGWQFVFFGLGAITYAKHPEGILEYQKRKSLDAVQRMAERFKRKRAPEDGPVDDDQLLPTPERTATAVDS